jgi:hypothetical protein
VAGPRGARSFGAGLRPARSKSSLRVLSTDSVRLRASAPLWWNFSGELCYLRYSGRCPIPTMFSVGSRGSTDGGVNSDRRTEEVAGRRVVRSTATRVPSAYHYRQCQR